MTGYRLYRPKGTIKARTVGQDIRVFDSTGAQVVIAAGSYEVLGEDGVISYQSKDGFEAANEPTRAVRVRQAKPKRKKQTVPPDPNVGRDQNTGREV